MDIQNRTVIKVEDIPQLECEIKKDDLVRVARPFLARASNQVYKAAHYYAYSQKLVLRANKLFTDDKGVLKVELYFDEPIVVLKEDNTWRESKGIAIEPEFLEVVFEL